MGGRGRVHGADGDLHLGEEVLAGGPRKGGWIFYMDILAFKREFSQYYMTLIPIKPHLRHLCRKEDF